MPTATHKKIARQIETAYTTAKTHRATANNWKLVEHVGKSTPIPLMEDLAASRVQNQNQKSRQSQMTIVKLISKNPQMARHIIAEVKNPQLKAALIRLVNRRTKPAQKPASKIVAENRRRAA